MQIQQVDGSDAGKIMLFTLSTCGWCRKTKSYLNQLGVAYSYIDVDTLSEAEKDQVMDEVERWNPSCSFPTMVVNNQSCIVGFNEGRIDQALGR